jgi:hypothetical protein
LGNIIKMDQCNGKCSYENYTSRFVEPQAAIFYYCAVMVAVAAIARVKEMRSGFGDFGNLGEMFKKVLAIVFAPAFIGLVTFCALPTLYIS